MFLLIPEVWLLFFLNVCFPKENQRTLGDIFLARIPHGGNQRCGLSICVFGLIQLDPLCAGFFESCQKHVGNFAYTSALKPNSCLEFSKMQNLIFFFF